MKIILLRNDYVERRNDMKRGTIVLIIMVVMGFILTGIHESMAGQEGREVAWTTVVKPKPLSNTVNGGLKWLVSHQHKTGGWGQGEESEAMRHGMDQLKDLPNVADTCIATLALLRSGSSPKAGPYSANIMKALDFICDEIEKSEAKGLYITSVKGTRVQTKLGPYIDTFLAALVLAEVKGKMPDGISEKRITLALQKTMRKIEENQKQDGTWDNTGWAPTLSQSVAGKAINRAAQSGVAVNEQVRTRTETYARGQFDSKSGGFSKDGSAGVDLYSSASSIGNMQESDNTNRLLMEQTKNKLARAKNESEKKQLQAELNRYEQNQKDLDQARDAVIKKLEDKRFIQGFGSNGGEEYLSYMSIGESLVVKGGKEWQKWDSSMTQNLNHIQNKDGSWTGHHCITGRTFCTAAALLVLLVDRTPVPVAAKIKK